MRTILKKYLPSPFITILRALNRPINLMKQVHEIYLIKTQPRRYEKIINELKHKDKIKVAFFAIHSSVWKYDSLYRLMCAHPRFEPIIVVCPVVNYGFENMLIEMDKCYEMFIKKGYHVVRTYNVKTKEYMDVKKHINPDIVFYTNPYKGLIDDRYYITNFLDRLTCYVPYGYANLNVEWNYNLPFHNLLWILFGECELNLEETIKWQRLRGLNYVISGYPLYDDLLEQHHDVWKLSDKNMKRIIWAPHHTITDAEGLSFSNFIRLHQGMFTIAEKYKNSVQICFKPHPLLKEKLYADADWGKKRTDEYYKKWDLLPNGFLQEGDYIDLFTFSDALIHDCGSFTIEYLFLWKNPVLYISKGERLDKSNKVAQLAYDNLYHGYTLSEIEDFIQNVVLEGKDTMKENRYKFYIEHLLPPNHQTAGENILTTLEDKLR